MTLDQRWDHLLLDVGLATLADNGAPYGAIEDGAIAWRDGRIVFAGSRGELQDEPHALAHRVESLPGTWVTPGLIDCHTHLVFGGDRAHEFERRLEGATYEEIARAGGGIVSSVRATRAASEDDLLRQSLPRARALLADGVTTLEIKSGYGLEPETERRMLRVARRIGNELGVDVRTSFLGLHALPPEYAGRRDEYVALVCDIMLPSLAEEELVDAVDAFCEGIGFTHEETRRLFEKATELGLPVKLHAEQLSDLGGAALVASHGGLSADHLEWISEDGVRSMADAGTVAVLLPGAYYALRDTRPPPVDAFRRHGVPMAVATDLNPGTSPLLSLRMAMGMACTLFRLTPEEALRGATVNAARALGLDDRGRLAVGLRADLAIWNVGQLAELSYWIGGGLLRETWIAGERTTR
ncbi:imidazolonepropionase [Luteibacter sp. E-22]|uniref:imidazolonepropionase n=1 Tax=Luteibacter sp. E-22 TaxID=3404050 RepID=UPI003CECF44E